MKLFHAEDGIEIWHGDCREFMSARVPDEFAALVTDPPYGVTYSSGWDNSLPGIVGDEDTSIRDSVLTWWGERPAIVFGSWKRPRPAATRALLTWDKGLAAGMGDLALPWKPNTEEVYVLGTGFSGRRGTSVLSYVAVPPNQLAGTRRREHPHEKPIPLMTHLIAACPEGAILDPFLGSGSTLVAARELGRRAVGVEVEERYCEIAANRLRQRLLFGGAP